MEEEEEEERWKGKGKGGGRDGVVVTVHTDVGR